MRALTILGTALWCGACAPADEAGETPPIDPTEMAAPPETDAWPSGDLAGFHIDLGDGSDPVVLSAVATESAPSFVNLAQCAVNPDVPCLTQLPEDPDDFILPSSGMTIERELINTRFLGWTVGLGDYELEFREDPDNQFGYYVKTLTEEEPAPQGWVGSRWEGYWLPYANEEMLFVSDPIQLVAPREGGHVAFHDGDRVPFEWVPTGEGQVTLNVVSNSVERMYLLEDDGYFEIVANDLGVTALTEDFTFTFMRWNAQEHVVRGHVVDLVATSRATFTGEFFQTGGREYARAADGCAEATGLAPLEDGGYWGNLGDFTADLNPQGTCLGPGCAGGFDGIHKVEVPPNHVLQLTYDVYDDSAAFYLLSDCTDEGSCFTGADFDNAINAPEFINYFNTSDDLRRFYLVVDSAGGTCPFGNTPVASYYTLDVDLDVLEEPPMYDSCVEAEDAPATPYDNYFAEFTAYTDALNPGVGGCTGTSTSGTDAMTPIEVGANQTVTVNVRMPGGNPAIYFLYDCDNEFSCPAGCDVSLNDQELCSYTNGTKAPQRLYVVVDSQAGLLPYFLAIQ